MWVARDEDGDLWFYNQSPKRGSNIWTCDNTSDMSHLSNDMFPNLKWEDEPIEVNVIPNESLKGLYKIIDKYKNSTPDKTDYETGYKDAVNKCRKKVEYWFKNIGPFVFPEDEETLDDLLEYFDKNCSYG